MTTAKETTNMSRVMHEADNGRPQNLGEMHARLVQFRDQLIAGHNEKLADLDAAIAAVVARKIPPPLTVDRRECRHCAGWIVGTPRGWVHDRDGGPACASGHSGTLAEPLEQTTAFPAVSPAQRPDTTGWLRSVCVNCGVPVLQSPGEPWIHHFTNHPECRADVGGHAAPNLIYPWWTHRTQWSGVADHYVCAEPGTVGQICGKPVQDTECPIHGQDVEVSDATHTLTPAATTLPDGEVHTDG
jgi:hypothetical protein